MQPLFERDPPLRGGVLVGGTGKAPILEMRGMRKAFAGVHALEGVDFRAFAGEVMALLGENGAGKSTLMKILAGVYSADSGEMRFEGRILELRGPRDAQARGISIIHQELNLVPDLSIAENIFLGREPVHAGGRLDWKRLNKEASALLEGLGVKSRPDRRLGALTVGQQQMVEIAKAISFNSKIIVMDEPTGALTDTETESLFRVIRELRAAGKAVVYISHRLSEVFAVCDRATVLRDGRLVGERTVAELDEDAIIEMMVGRRLTEQYPRIEIEAGPARLSVEGLEGPRTKGASFEARAGEILGVTGLMGAGRTELALALFGALPVTKGRILLDGAPYRPRSPHEAIAAGIAYVSEDRKDLGLLLDLGVGENMTLPALRTFQGAFFSLSASRERSKAREFIGRLQVKTTGPTQAVRNLSGGNQQKVSIAKGLVTTPRLLILDEPTRGVDVGAKKEIYGIMNELKRQGLAIMMLSSELAEILGMSDRVMVMHEGEVAGVFGRDEASQERIMRLAIGIKEGAS